MNLHLPALFAPCQFGIFKGCYFKNFFAISKSKINSLKLVRGCTIFELIEEILKELLNKQIFLPLGFDQDKTPNRDWFMDVLSSIAPEHEYFKEIEKLRVQNLSEEKINFFNYF